MTVFDRARLERLVGSTEFAWLLDRARTRLEAGLPLTGAVTRANATDAERAAAASVLGRRVGAGRTLTIRLEDLDEVVRSSGVAAGLAAAVVALRGPIVNRRDLAERASRDWDAAFVPLAALAESDPSLAGWLSWVRSTGAVRRAAKDADVASDLLRRVALVLGALPSPGESLARFANRVLGDAHGLDASSSTAALVLSALRSAEGHASSAPLTAALRRSLWGSVGIALDELSSTVLVHALPGAVSSASGASLESLRLAGEPVVLTLRQIRRGDVVVAGAAITVSVCENPAVVAAAAEQLGAACAPLICLSGQPSAAALALLGAVIGAGARLRYHGDFDWGGLRIADSVIRRFSAEPWRFRTGDYVAAVRPEAPTLRGSRAEASWDPELAPTMQRIGRRVEEEQVLDALLQDLKI